MPVSDVPCLICRSPIPNGYAAQPTGDAQGFTCSALCAFRDESAPADQRVDALREAVAEGDAITATLTVEADAEGVTTTTITGPLAEAEATHSVVVLGTHRDAKGGEWEDPAIDWDRVVDAAEAVA